MIEQHWVVRWHDGHSGWKNDDVIHHEYKPAAMRAKLLSKDPDKIVVRVAKVKITARLPQYYMVRFVTTLGPRLFPRFFVTEHEARDTARDLTQNKAILELSVVRVLLLQNA